MVSIQSIFAIKVYQLLRYTYKNSLSNVDHEAITYTTGGRDEARGTTPASSFQGGFEE